MTTQARELGRDILVRPSGGVHPCTIDRWWTEGDFEYVEFQLHTRELEAFVWLASRSRPYTPRDIRYWLCEYCGRYFDRDRCVEVVAVDQLFRFQLKFVHIFALDKLNEYREAYQTAAFSTTERVECTEVQQPSTYSRFFGEVSG